MISSRLSVRTSTRLGTAETGVDWLGTYGPISNVSARWARTGGCTDLTFTWRVPARWGRGEVPAVRRGRAVELRDGAYVLWSGRVTSCQRTDGTVSVGCRGWADSAVDYPAASTALNTPGAATTAGLAASVDVAVDNAIARGWSVTRPASLGGVLPTAVEPNADLLARASTATGLPWGVNRLREVVYYPAPTAARVLVRAIERPADYTTQQYLTGLMGTFISNTTGTPVKYMSVGVAGIVATLDLTELGAIPDTVSTASQRSALDILNSALAKTAPLPPSITGAFGVTDVTDMGGMGMSASRLGPMLEGGLRLRLKGVQPSASGDLNLTSSVEVDASEVAWDADSDSATVTPVGGEDRSIGNILRGLSTPVERNELGQFV